MEIRSETKDLLAKAGTAIAADLAGTILGARAEYHERKRGDERYPEDPPEGATVYATFEHGSRWWIRDIFRGDKPWEYIATARPVGKTYWTSGRFDLEDVVTFERVR